MRRQPSPWPWPILKRASLPCPLSRRYRVTPGHEDSFRSSRWVRAGARTGLIGTCGAIASAVGEDPTYLFDGLLRVGHNRLVGVNQTEFGQPQDRGERGPADRMMLSSAAVPRACQMRPSTCLATSWRIVSVTCRYRAAMSALDQARAQAALGPGRAGETRAALDRAESIFSQLDDGATISSAFAYNEAQLHFHLGNALTHLHDTEGARREQERALHLYPASDFLDRTLTSLDRAYCLAHDGDTKEAVSYATQALTGLTGQQCNGMIHRVGPCSLGASGQWLVASGPHNQGCTTRPAVPDRIASIVRRHSMPRSASLHNHTASSRSVFGRPGTFFTSRAFTSQHSVASSSR